MSVTTANMTEKMEHTNGHANGYTNGHTNGYINGCTQDEHGIVTSIRQEPVTSKRQPWVAPKDSKLLHPGTNRAFAIYLSPANLGRRRSRQPRSFPRVPIRHNSQRLGRKACAPDRATTTLRLLRSRSRWCDFAVRHLHRLPPGWIRHLSLDHRSVHHTHQLLVSDIEQLDS